MRATYIPPIKTPVTPTEASRGYYSALVNLTKAAVGPEFVAVLHAHGALETGRFKSCYNWNCGNIKAGQEYAGFYTCFPILNEKLPWKGKLTWRWFSGEGELFDDNGEPASPANGGKVRGDPLPVPEGHPQSRFRAFESFSKGVEDKIRFLMGDRWKHCLAFARAGDPAGYVEAIRDMGYFTADLAPYSRGVTLLYREYLPLAQGFVSEPEDLGNSNEIEACIGACSRLYVPSFTPDPNWDAVNADRDAEIRGD